MTPPRRRAADAYSEDVVRALGRIEGRLEVIDGTLCDLADGIGAVNTRLDGHLAAAGKGSSGALATALAALGVAITTELARRGLLPPL